MKVAQTSPSVRSLKSEGLKSDVKIKNESFRKIRKDLSGIQAARDV
jgi:hypothetical protein